MTHYKIITLWQPYATLIALGLKRHETRDWDTGYRGPVLIHAAKRFDTFVRQCYEDAMVLLAEAREVQPHLPSLPAKPILGAIVCRARVITSRPMPMWSFDGQLLAASPVDDLDREFGNWSPGRYAHRLTDVQPMAQPICWVGRQGKYMDVPDEICVAVDEQLGAPAVTSQTTQGEWF